MQLVSFRGGLVASSGIQSVVRRRGCGGDRAALAVWHSPGFSVGNDRKTLIAGPCCCRFVGPWKIDRHHFTAEVRWSVF